MQKALEAHAEKIGAPPSVLHIPSTAEMRGDGPFRQAKWFTLIWQERRLYAWERRQLDKGAVVFVGDSITQGWLSLGRAFPNLKTANRGITGDTSRGVLYRLDEDVLQLEPRAVVLLCGINDLGDGATPQCIVQNIQNMIGLCRKQNSNMPVIICTVLPVGADQKALNDLVGELNVKLMRLVEGNANIFLADTWNALADTNGVARAGDFPDLAHPNQSGYAKLENFLRPILENILSLPQH